MTQMEYARKGIITPQIKYVAGVEQRSETFIAERVAAGTIVIPANINHKNLVPCGIGRELKTKINANTETMQLIGAKNMLSDYRYNQRYLADCCSVVSNVYECALATSLSSQQKLEQRGVDAKNAELNASNLIELQENFKSNPMFAFTSKPFERNGCATVENARDTINQINSLDLNYVPWALDLITEATETAQKTMVIMHSDFDASMGITD